MTVLDMLARTRDLEAALSRLVTLLQSDTLDQELLDQLDEATRDAGRLLAAAEPPRAVAAQPARQPAKKPAAKPGKKVCAVDGCDGPHLAKGYCGPHYARVKAHGDPQAHIPVTRRKSRKKPPPKPTPTRPPPAGNGSGVLDDAERERLRQQAAELRDSDPAEAKRLTDRLYGITA